MKSILDPAIQKFIRDHENHDPFQFVLKAKKFPDWPVKEVAAQIHARQKAKLKLPTWYQTSNIIMPPVLSIEQASSETTAKYKFQNLHGNTAIDLTGGTGVDTFYLAQNYEKVVYVESDQSLLETTRHNFQQLAVKNVEFVRQTAEEFLQEKHKPVDLVYLDPSRRVQKKVFRLEDCQPNVQEILPDMGRITENIFIKTSPLLDIKKTILDLKSLSEIMVLAVENECKEVNYLLDKKQDCMYPSIVATHLKKDSEENFTFNYQQETEAELKLCEPQNFIYEPNPAILKAGAFKYVANCFILSKLHINSHFYTAEELNEDFPGRIFLVKEIVGYHKKHKRLLPVKANVISRNFPDSVAQIRKKLSIREGGEGYLLATTDLKNQKVIILADRLK